MARAVNPEIEAAVRQLEEPDPLAHAARHFIDRQSVGGDRVPDADKRDTVNLLVVAFFVTHPEQIEEKIAKLPKQPLDAPDGMEFLGAIRAVGHFGFLIK